MPLRKAVELIVSVGGITLTSSRGTFRFLWQALKSLRQAKKAKGCIHAAIFRDADMYFALSVWETVDDMQSYGSSAAHVAAIRKTDNIVKSAINRTYETAILPDRNDAISEWRKATTFTPPS